MINSKRLVQLLSLLMTLSVTSVFGQNPYTVETRPPRGFMPTADQLTSPVDSIDPISGKLHLEIPLASLPRGRAGTGFDLNLVYDSHLYDLVPEVLQPPPNLNTKRRGCLESVQLFNRGLALQH